MFGISNKTSFLFICQGLVIKNNLLEIKDLKVGFHSDEGFTRVIKGISFEVKEGETVGLVGESGSGKSVTSMSIMGLIPKPPGEITNGTIKFRGQNLVNLTNQQYSDIRGSKISMIFQEPMTSLNPVMKVGNQVLETILLHQEISKEDGKRKVIELFKEVGIPFPAQRYHYYPHQMSGGQKQRVMIAMAIACEPKLLICDEPTTALDVTIQKQVLELLLELQKKRKMGILFITHDLAVIGDIADKVLVMYKGEIVEEGSCEEIFSNPKHPYTKGLISCRPKLEKNPKRLLTVSDFIDTSEGNQKFVEPVLSAEIKKPNRDKSDPILEIVNLKKHFPIKGGFWGRTVDHFKAVDGVDMKIGKGKVVGLVGESGCGKTTLGRTILRLIEPTVGSIIFKNENLKKFDRKELKKFRRNAQIIFQDPFASLNPRMTIGEILTEPLKIHHVGNNQKERIEQAMYYLDKVQLEKNHLNRYPHEFSGGQRQRICIARALMLRPELIICDESVSALDVSVQAQVLNLLLDLKDEFDLSYLFISHDLNVVKFISDEIGVMQAGKIVEYNYADEIYNNPQQRYTRELLSAIPAGKPSNI